MPQDYYVDYEDGIKDPVGMSGVRLEADFHVITAQTNAINNINKCVKRAGLEIENLILEPLASSLSVLSDEEKEAGVCLVDIGGGTTDIAIFHENIIRHTAVIPLGGNIINQDIKQGCMVMQHQAELLKTKFGKAIAEEAGQAILRIYHQDDFEVQTKSDQSPLTQADLASHDIITKALNKLTPEIPILSEEGEQLRGDVETFWCVDPLDGTKEFIKRNGEFTVNIALIENHQPVLGVIHIPVANELLLI